MNIPIPVVNQTLNLADCRDKWFFDEAWQVWCLEDILYTDRATTPKFQRMSIFVPKPYLNPDGTVNPEGSLGRFTAKTAPVIFENNSAGYMQMPHTWLGGPRDEAGKYLARGMVYVTCGSRGRESRDEAGKLCAKAPWTLVDLKTGIRFLRHNRNVLPGSFDKMISVGWSAGGAMSSLLAVTGDNPVYDSYLAGNGAFMDESDAVFAAQIYCPIVDLEHADLAYEWQFARDEENEASPAGPAGKMDAFRKALSGELAKDYIAYFNGLGLTDPISGQALRLNKDGRSGTAYDALMRLLEASAADYLARLDRGTGTDQWTSADYLAGNYVHKVPAPKPPMGGPDGKDDLGLHHAGAPVALPVLPGEPPFGDKPPFGDLPPKPMQKPSLGDLVSRPPKGVPYKGLEFPMVDAPGTDKRSWLSWNGEQASITSLDDYLLHHRRRMKPCTSFDALGNDSGENQEFGTAEQDYLHFDPAIAPAIARLKDRFPAEYDRYYKEFAAVLGDAALEEREALINPMQFIGNSLQRGQTAHCRIRVGAQDADTAFTVSMALACKLAQAGCDVDYALVWDRPHCQADYPGEVCDWIEALVK